MDTTYKIFMRLTDAGPPLWIETVTSLEEAKFELLPSPVIHRGALKRKSQRLAASCG
jgi:hypothetical protein